MDAVIINSFAYVSIYSMEVEASISYSVQLWFNDSFIDYELVRFHIDREGECAGGKFRSGFMEVIIPVELVEKYPDAAIIVRAYIDFTTPPAFLEGIELEKEYVLRNFKLGVLKQFFHLLKKTKLNEREERVYEQLLAWLESQPRKKEKKGKKKRFRFF